MLVEELGDVPADSTRPLPGDKLLPNARVHKTHATTIEAAVDHVWPWLLQMGARRAGWYSFDFLDNGGVPSADHIIPELQSLSVGDIIPALPKSSGGFAVLSLDALNRAREQELAREVAELRARVAELERQLAARSVQLPDAPPR